MSTITGILGIEDNEQAFVNTTGQELVFDAVNQVLVDYTVELGLVYDVFIEKETEAYKYRYLLPGGGKLQRLDDYAPAGAMKRTGYYDVAFPRRPWGVKVGWTRKAISEMTIAMLDSHMDTVKIQDLNTMRWRILTSLFENDNYTFNDDVWGDLIVRRLANEDGTAYPPVLGSETEADDQHYLNTGYDVADIDDTHDPTVTLRDEIAEHFGGIGTFGRNFVYFHGNDQLADLKNITGYQAFDDQFVKPGVATAEITRWPRVPGRLHARLNGVWLSEWDGWIPDTYGLMVLTDVPAPLTRRINPAKGGLGKGLLAVATNEHYPLYSIDFEHYYGHGCGNRLSAACILIDETGEYTPPTAYTE